MKIAFFSNFLNHHQLPFCNALYSRFKENFHFVATTPIPEERKMLGYADINCSYPFAIRAYEDKAQLEKAFRIAEESDVVIMGSAPMKFAKKRLKNKKVTFYYSERLYKKGYEWWKFPKRMISHFREFSRYKSLYLLCASAYTAADFSKSLAFLGKAYKWGYFPEVKIYPDINKVVAKKQPNRILWAGRFIDWKHPEYAVEVARRLRDNGYNFEINMIGTGEEQQSILDLIKDYKLEKHVRILGSMSPEEVRENMENSSIFLFTSDRGEGWGAVLNESMNSGCAVVADNLIGSVPFLLKDNQNGLIYKDGDVTDLFNKVKYLLDNPEKCRILGVNAYETLANLWNAETAANRIVELSEALLKGNKKPRLFSEGPVSRAPLLKDK